MRPPRIQSLLLTGSITAECHIREAIIDGIPWMAVQLIPKICPVVAKFCKGPKTAQKEHFHSTLGSICRSNVFCNMEEVLLECSYSVPGLHGIWRVTAHQTAEHLMKNSNDQCIGQTLCVTLDVLLVSFRGKIELPPCSCCRHRSHRWEPSQGASSSFSPRSARAMLSSQQSLLGWGGWKPPKRTAALGDTWVAIQ